MKAAVWFWLVIALLGTAWLIGVVVEILGRILDAAGT